MATWPAVHRRKYLAREEVLNLVPPGFIGCYGHVRLISAGCMKPGGIIPDSPSLVPPIRPCSLASPIYNIVTRCTPQTFLYTPLSGAPKKCFQSGPALAKASPVLHL